jgi:hypothetical protein
VSELVDIGSLDAAPENEGWLRDINEAMEKAKPDAGVNVEEGSAGT